MLVRPGHLLGPAKLHQGVIHVAHAASRISDAVACINSSHEKVPAVEICPSSAYVHLPFCKKKCFYCDFPVEAVGRTIETRHVQDRMQRYVSMVCAEIQATCKIGTESLQTVYFGGGTPSLVPPAMIAQILESLDKKYGISSTAEISLEADPGTFDLARLRQYMNLGVDRVSMGVQAFQQELLEACGRSHSLEEVHAAIAAVHDSGIPTWSLDLISGLPNLTPELWQQSLDAAVAAQPKHISVYDLQIEQGTPFERLAAKGTLKLPVDDTAADMYGQAVATLTGAGYEHYEVSNYGKPGHRSRHNQVYWAGTQYYAFGLGAASYLGGRRFSRPAAMKDYTAWLDTLTSAAGEQGALPGADLEADSEEDRMLDHVMLRLRTADGLDLNTFAAKYGQGRAQQVLVALDQHFKSGHALRTDPHTQGSTAEGTKADVLPTVRLSDPDGFLLSNDVISDVFAELTSDS